MPTGIYKRTEYHKKMISNSLKGRKLSEQNKFRIAIALKGNINSKNRILSEKHKKRISISNKGKHSIKRSIAAKRRVFEGRNNLWKGGISPINKIIRRSLKYRLWREAVFKRDNWTCQECSQRGGRLHPHHLKTFAYFPDLRFELSNGQTLCKNCHKLTDTYAGRNREKEMVKMV